MRAFGPLRPSRRLEKFQKRTLAPAPHREVSSPNHPHSYPLRTTSGHRVIGFVGQYEHQMDPKGRVSLPSRIRDVLTAEGDGRYVLTPAPADLCLHLHPMRRWEEYEQAVSKLPRHDRRIVRFRRIYVSAAQEGELDKVGRIRLPPEFRERIHLEGKDVVFAGMGSMVEI